MFVQLLSEMLKQILVSHRINRSILTCGLYIANLININTFEMYVQQCILT